jgi:hypothetical protein
MSRVKITGSLEGRPGIKRELTPTPQYCTTRTSLEVQMKDMNI